MVNKQLQPNISEASRLVGLTAEETDRNNFRLEKLGKNVLILSHLRHVYSTQEEEKHRFWRMFEGAGVNQRQWEVFVGDEFNGNVHRQNSIDDSDRDRNGTNTWSMWSTVRTFEKDSMWNETISTKFPNKFCLWRN